MDTVLRTARAKLKYEFENKYLITFELQFNVWCDAKQTDIFTIYSVIWIIWICINNRSNLLRVNLKKKTRVTKFCICRLHSNDLRVSLWNSEDITMKINLYNIDRVFTTDIEQCLTELIYKWISVVLLWNGIIYNLLCINAFLYVHVLYTLLKCLYIIKRPHYIIISNTLVKFWHNMIKQNQAKLLFNRFTQILFLENFCFELKIHILVC